jgi:hypothetical protein
MKTLITKTLFNARATTGVSDTFDVRNSECVVVAIATASSGNLTLKFSGSSAPTAPAFGTAASASNIWTRLSLTNIESPATPVAGDTGFAVTGTDAIRHYRIDTRGLSFIAAEVTARTAGNVSVVATSYTEI